jgi:hypothetical protein
MKIPGNDYKALEIEKAFDRLFGSNDPMWRAGVFTHGTPAQLGTLLIKASEELNTRISQMKFSDEDKQNGGAQGTLTGSVKRIKELGTALQGQDDSSEESNDYRWMLVGDLIAIISVLLERAS